MWRFSKLQEIKLSLLADRFKIDFDPKTFEVNVIEHPEVCVLNETAEKRMADSESPSLSEVLYVVVAVITSQRTASLDRLLLKMADMTLPMDIRVRFLVVENHSSGSAKSVVESHRDKLENLAYVVEPRRGIPVARNRALKEAETWGADALCFIDDDEYPDELWLVNLLRCWRKTHAQLIGGPVIVSPDVRAKSLWKRIINSSLVSRQNRKNAKTQRYAKNGKKFTIVTNNWLCDMGWIRESGHRFDETLLHSGGSDTLFHLTAREMGCRSFWCPDARVFECVSDERLSLQYQFERARCQSINHFGMRHPVVTAGVATSAILIATLRTLAGILLLFLPIKGRASLTVGVRSLGWATGRIQAIKGAKSRLYEKD